MAKVEKLPPKRNSAGSEDYIVEMPDGRTVQVQINPYSNPYYYQPLDNNEMVYVLKLIDEYKAANPC
jgi:hypothetical protein